MGGCMGGAVQPLGSALDRRTGGRVARARLHGHVGKAGRAMHALQRPSAPLMTRAISMRCGWKGWLPVRALQPSIIRLA